MHLDGLQELEFVFFPSGSGVGWGSADPCWVWSKYKETGPNDIRH